MLPNLTIFGQQVAGREHLGIATALLQSLRMIGGMIGKNHSLPTAARYCRAVRALSGIGRLKFVRNGLMSSPPRRV